jgi:hypothetical protein
MKMIAVALTAGGIWAFAQQPSVQTDQTYPWIGCPWRNVSGAAYTNNDSTNTTLYHTYHGRFYRYNNYGCCY